MLLHILHLLNYFFLISHPTLRSDIKIFNLFAINLPILQEYNLKALIFN